MDPNTVLVWVQVGQTLVQIGEGSYTAVKTALAAQGIVADDAQLAALDRLYAQRIARRTNPAV